MLRACQFPSPGTRAGRIGLGQKRTHRARAKRRPSPQGAARAEPYSPSTLAGRGAVPGRGAVLRHSAPPYLQVFRPSPAAPPKSPLKSRHFLGGLDMDADYMLCFIPKCGPRRRCRSLSRRFHPARTRIRSRQTHVMQHRTGTSFRPRPGAAGKFGNTPPRSGPRREVDGSGKSQRRTLDLFCPDTPKHERFLCSPLQVPP